MNPVLAALDAVIAALVTKQDAALASYAMYYVEKDDPKKAELADWYLGQWRGLRDALEVVRAERTSTVYALADAALDAVTA